MNQNPDGIVFSTAMWEVLVCLKSDGCELALSLRLVFNVPDLTLSCRTTVFKVLHDITEATSLSVACGSSIRQRALWGIHNKQPCRIMRTIIACPNLANTPVSLKLANRFRISIDHQSASSLGCSPRNCSSRISKPCHFL